MNDIAADDEDLEFAVDERAIEELIAGLCSHDLEAAHRVYRDDAVLYQPQYGRTTKGRQNILALRKKNANRQLLQVSAVIGEDDLWIAETLREEDARRLVMVNVIEFCDGQIIREREYLCPQ